MFHQQCGRKKYPEHFVIRVKAASESIFLLSSCDIIFQFKVYMNLTQSLGMYAIYFTADH